MPSPNQHIREELERFRKMPGPAFYAVQINAPWGAGKSFFVTNYLKEVSPAKPNEDGPLSIRVTLFGSQSIDDLEDQVVSQIFSKSDQVIGTIFSGLISGAAKHLQSDKLAESFIDSAKTTAISNRLKIIRGGLIVFDDLERARMPLKDALGYINRFIETEGFKVVLISNEDAFFHPDASTEDNANGRVLKAFKEKLVGRTLRLTADPASALDSFMSKMLDERSKALVLTHKTVIMQLFAASGRENLRSLRIGMEAFDRLAPILSSKVWSKPQALREILLSCLYIAVELAAAVDEEVICNPTAGRMRRLVGALGARKEETMTPAEQAAAELVKRYGELVNFDRPPIPFDILIQIIAHGHLDAELVNTAAESSSLVADPKDLPPWRHLIEVWDLDIDTMKIYTELARKQFHDLEVTDPGELLHLAGIMLWRASYGDLSLSDDKPPFEFIQTYLDRLYHSGRHLVPLFEKMPRSAFAAHGYVAIAPDEATPELARIRLFIQVKVDITLRARFPEMRKKIIDFLGKSKSDRIFQDLHNGQNQLSQYVRLPIFEGADPVEIVDLILKDKSFDYAILDWLSERYQLTNTLLVPEGSWLRSVAHELHQQVSAAPAPLNAFWTQISEARLGPLLTQLEVPV